MTLSLRAVTLGAALAGLACGLVAWSLGWPQAGLIWTLGALPGLITLVWQIVTSLARGQVGLDIVAALSMTAAIAFGETLAAAVVALMYAGGQYLESFAEARARREMTALLARAPRHAMRHGAAGLEQVALEAIHPGDSLLIRTGDVAPADGVVGRGLALIDQSSLTGESLPVKRAPGQAVLSGSVCLGDAFDLTVQSAPADSALAAIVAMVQAAHSARAPMVRMADRAALGFLALTLVLAGAAWALTGDPIRAVAVLVVATPCPLILAVPVALVAGLSRAAARGILVKGGQVLERLGQIRAVVLDKTGTLTHGSARVSHIATHRGWSDAQVLGLAAALDQASAHVVARALGDAARARGLALPTPSQVTETPGDGIAGQVDGHAVVVGGDAWVRARIGIPAVAPAIPAALAVSVLDPAAAPTAPAATPSQVQADPPSPAAPPAAPGSLRVTVAIDGALAGEITLSDPLRNDIPALLAALRALGIRQIVLATGDRADVAQAVARGLGFDAIHTGLDPAAKIAVVQALKSTGPVMMVGDGVNDAPALAAADVGVAMGARGAAASAQTADVVLLVDDIARLLPALRIARRARAIAGQSVAAGLGLSLLGMVAAAFGLITPVQGALVQEAIDVAVILNALRALQGGDA